MDLGLLPGVGPLLHRIQQYICPGEFQDFHKGSTQASDRDLPEPGVVWDGVNLSRSITRLFRLILEHSYRSALPLYYTHPNYGCIASIEGSEHYENRNGFTQYG